MQPAGRMSSGKKFWSHRNVVGILLTGWRWFVSSGVRSRDSGLFYEAEVRSVQLVITQKNGVVSCTNAAFKTSIIRRLSSTLRLLYWAACRKFMLFIRILVYLMKCKFGSPDLNLRTTVFTVPIALMPVKLSDIKTSCHHLLANRNTTKTVTGCYPTNRACSSGNLS